MPTYLGFSSICTSCVSAGPSLHDTGSIGPGNCSGSAGGECGDPRYWTVCRDPGNAGLPRSAPIAKVKIQGNESPVLLWYRLDQVPQAGVLADGDGEGTSIRRQAETTVWV